MCTAEVKSLIVYLNFDLFTLFELLLKRYIFEYLCKHKLRGVGMELQAEFGQINVPETCWNLVVCSLNGHISYYIHFYKI